MITLLNKEHYLLKYLTLTAYFTLQISKYSINNVILELFMMQLILSLLFGKNADK